MIASKKMPIGSHCEGYVIRCICKVLTVLKKTNISHNQTLVVPFGSLFPYYILSSFVPIVLEV